MSFWGFEQDPDEIVLMYVNCQVGCLREAARVEMKKRRSKKANIKHKKKEENKHERSSINSKK